jgi:chorismate mutase
MATTASPQELLQLIGMQFREADFALACALSARSKLSLQVCEIKNKHGLPLVRKDVEEERIEEFRNLLKENGHTDPEFAVALYRMIIAQSTVSQVAHLEKKKSL